MIQRAEGAMLWTTDGRQLFDFTSGVLVANLGHSPNWWIERFERLMGWDGRQHAPLNVYNAATPIEVTANHRLLALLKAEIIGRRLDRIVWAASGSEAVHKALWAALRRDPKRDIILATRPGFHVKKGLAYAVTGTETDSERDLRVRFISFPMAEVADVSLRTTRFPLDRYADELSELSKELGPRIAALITEPYLGGGGSYHPSSEYLRLLETFCRDHDALFILDEVQSNFGRTGALFAFQKHCVEPDLVILGKSLGNGFPVAAVAGQADVLDPLPFGELSDTWSANPASCAAVVATLEGFADPQILLHARGVSAIIESSLCELKDYPIVKYVRGEDGGMVWGIETSDFGSRSAQEWANALVLAAYQGDGNQGVHLLGPLAGKVIRIAPPLTVTVAEAQTALGLLHLAVRKLSSDPL